jgi:catalase-peroxidase
MGPLSRYLGPEVPKEKLLWQDPIPEVKHTLVNAADVRELKKQLLASGIAQSDLVTTAWAAASTFRHTDKRGGANGARLRLAPQKDWRVNQPTKLAAVLTQLEKIRATFNGAQSGDKQISMADLIVLGGCAAVEAAAKSAGVDVEVAFTPGRGDATAEMTDVDGMRALEPKIDGFRNYVGDTTTATTTLRVEEALLDRASLLSLTPVEMTVLVGGLRVLGATVDGSKHGVLTQRVGSLTPDFFANLLDMSVEWRVDESAPGVYVGVDRANGQQRWTATRADLIFGSNSQLRALAEVYACADAQQKFVRDFVAAFVKVMNLDRFDVPSAKL